MGLDQIGVLVNYGPGYAKKESMMHRWMFLQPSYFFAKLIIGRGDAFL